MPIQINPEKCLGCGTCAALCPDVFELATDKARVKNPTSDAPCVQEAVAACPAQAISVQ
ncbi:MAG: ferredoxin [Patescibacteria group bacterium]|nr:ferredoxin [Patescibacteria group bacterium]